MKQKIAIIGAGTMGRVHADAYSSIEEAELVGIVDVDRDSGEMLAARHGTSWFPDVQGMLDAGVPTVADICLPTHLHASYVRLLAEKGIHLICEKPIARTLDEASAMIETCRRAGVRLFIGHVVRFFPEYRSAHDLLGTHEIGSVATAFAMRGGRFPGGRDGWYADPERSGTLILDLMIHDFDFLRWCLGEVERVYAKSLRRSDLDQIDHAFVSLRFSGGAIGSVEGTWAYPAHFRTAFELSGDGGSLIHNSESEKPLVSYLRTDGSDPGELSEGPRTKSPYQTELEHFLHCIERNEEPIVTTTDAWRALEISLAALESASSGAPVVLGSAEPRDPSSQTGSGRRLGKAAKPRQRRQNE